MEITYKLTRAELGTLFRIGLGPGYAWSYFIAALPLVALGVICFVVGGWVFGLAISVCMLAIVAFQLRPSTASSRLEKRGEKMVAKEPLLDSARVLRVSEDGVERRIGDLTTTCPWSDIEQVSEVRGMIQLKIRGTKRGRISVPRRAFESDAQCEAFIQFVRAHVRPGVAN